MIGWLLLLLVPLLLALLLCMKVGVHLIWKEKAFSWKIRIGFLRLTFSGGKKQNETQSADQPQKKQKDRKRSAGLKKLFPILRDHWEEHIVLIGRVLRAPVLEQLCLHVAAGGSDASACAMNYGHVCAGIGAIMPVVHNSFRIKKQDISVSCRYDLPDISVYAETELALRLWELLVLSGAVLRHIISIRRSTRINQKAV